MSFHFLQLCPVVGVHLLLFIIAVIIVGRVGGNGAIESLDWMFDIILSQLIPVLFLDS